MLVLSRRPNERVIITDGNQKIEVTFVKNCGYQVRLGFDAPREWQIVREELIDGKSNGTKADTKTG